MNKGIKVLQWNAQGIFRKRPELKKKFEAFDIILISETWLKGIDRFIIINFDTIKVSRANRRGGGVAVFVWSGIKYVTINNFYSANNRIEVCGVNIKYCNRKLTLVSVYRPPDIIITQNEWSQFFSQFDDDVLIGGDFNAHHPLWSGKFCCPEGRKIFDTIVVLDFFCLNKGAATRFATSFSQKSAIDISFTNSANVLSAHWEVLDDSWGSDHLPITIELLGSNCNQTRFFNSYRIHSTKTNWSAVITELKDNIYLCSELVKDKLLDVQSKYASFMSLIENCVRKHTPARRVSIDGSQKIRANPWWDGECDKLVRLRRAAYLKFKHCMTREYYFKCKQADERSKFFFKKRKKELFMEFCS